MEDAISTSANVSFTCAMEFTPAPAPDTELVFKYARWLQKNNQLRQDKTINLEVERLYRVASEHGHYKANVNLQNGSLEGFFEVSGQDHLRLAQDLINANIATGYYLIGIFLQRGLASLRQDEEMALRYFKKAADLGSAQAQYFIGGKLRPIDIAPEIALSMYRCAAQQGHGKAALHLGVSLQTKEDYRGAIEAFQLGAAAGNETSAGFLEEAFRGPLPTNALYYAAQEQDLERADRYKRIWRILAGYSYADPKVPEINEIVPLPPAPLPAWDGKLQWLEARLANIPPEKPSEELIKRLADEKKLEPATGKPMPGAVGFSNANFPVKVCWSGQTCPQTGYWQVMWLPHEARGLMNSEVIRHFEEGAVMPRHTAERWVYRYWPLSDKHTLTEEVVRWGLLG